MTVICAWYTKQDCTRFCTHTCYAVTTTLAVAVGLVLVITIHPGNSDTLAVGCTNQTHSRVNDLDTLDSFLDLIR